LPALPSSEAASTACVDIGVRDCGARELGKRL